MTTGSHLPLDMSSEPGRGAGSRSSDHPQHGRGRPDEGVNDASVSAPKLGGYRFRQPSRKVICDATALLDATIIFALALLARWIYIDGYLGNDQEYGPYAVAGIICSLSAFVAFRAQGLYSFDVLATFRGQIRRLLFGFGVAILVLLSAAYLLKISQTFSRGWVLTWFSMSVCTLVIVHYGLSRLIQGWVSYGLFARNIAIYGSGEIAEKLTRHLCRHPERSNVVGVYDDLFGSNTGSMAVAGGLSDLIRTCTSTRLDEILIALPLSEETRIERVVTELSALPVDIRLCPDMSAFRLRPMGLLNYDGVAILELARRPIDHWGPILKMLEDKILSVLALTIAAPLMLFIALAIRLDSEGPVFFRQRRHGFNHSIISVIKFRTMTVIEDGTNVRQATRDDHRITRVGRFLRKTSLDELPQLLNVVRGEMSLVGPRPHALAHNEYYAAMLERYTSRHKVKPGITGWAQINGYRGETDTPEKMRLRMECDLYYIENWSLWFDLKILLLTPFYGLVGKNVY